MNAHILHNSEIKDEYLFESGKQLISNTLKTAIGSL